MPALLYGPPSLPHPSPAVFSPLQFQIQTRRNKDRTLSTATDGNSAPADVCVWKQGDFLFPRRRPDKQLATVGKVLSLFLSVEFEIIDACTGWKRAGREQKGAGYCRVDAPSGNEECGTPLTLKRMLEKQKTWRQALNLQQNCLSGTRVFCCKFCF